MYAFAKTPAPLLNTEDFRAVFGGEDGHSLPLDDQGLLRAVETVALVGTEFTIRSCTLQPHIVEVTTTSYPSSSTLYADERFLAPLEHPAGKVVVAPSADSVLQHMEALVGARYI